MKAKNGIEKYKYYISKRIDIFFHSLGKSQLKGRKEGPKVVLNSLPKSGTHLLESLFLQLPLMRHCGKKTLRLELQNPIAPKLKVLSSLKKGQFLLSHMQFHESVLEVSQTNNLRIIHLVRDPRDVLLSHLNYIEKMDTTQNSHKFISQYQSRFDKLKAMMEGKKDILEPFPAVLDKFSSWSLQKQVLCVKFEDLIGPNGGGDGSKQLESVKRICEFISIDLDENKIKEISDKIYSVKSSTFNKGKIGNWMRVLNEDEKKWINTILSNQIKSYGYEL